MIIYDLICTKGHLFEGWFDDADDYKKQHRSGILECPVCGVTEVQKVPSASHISLKRRAAVPDEGVGKGALLKQMQEHVERNYEDVGENFAEEARKMHYGEREQRNIRGAASWSEYKALREEGIEAVPFPAKPVPREKLN
ncbi:MAG TPA: DUF1178 family protein [Gammaproteobacteria bacterium]|nr:DUF1178 family protein [Gammaproteobacteria bacterium]